MFNAGVCKQNILRGHALVPDIYNYTNKHATNISLGEIY